eukprot:m.240934 g.240934  ORF g.240934 m.240934 type:complete len:276 (-) comp23810_c0_seq1:50-877(-)
MAACPNVVLNDGRQMPQLGLGVYLSEGGDCVAAVKTAISVGYRHIDTAEYYENESEVGEAIRTCGVPREQLFITTKLWLDGHGAAAAAKHFHRSLKNLGLEYVDLYLIHSPGGGRVLETYDALVKLQSEGLIRSIGVSNFGVQHLEGLRAAGKPLPVVNQIELHPFLQQHAIVEYCKKHNIVVQAYSPLTKGQWLKDPRLTAIAAKEGRSVAQVLIKWSLTKGFVCLPKSSNAERIAANWAMWDWNLTAEAQAALDALESDRHCTWDPTREPWTG